MIELKRVVPECNADTLLVELILRQGRAGHRHGITEVAKELQRHDDAVTYRVGLVDTDKFRREHPLVLAFSEHVCDKLADFGILICKIPDTNIHLIRLHPEFESWIWNMAIKYEIQSAEFGIYTFTDLDKACKRNLVREDVGLKAFINAIVQHDSEEIRLLRHWLRKVFEN